MIFNKIKNSYCIPCGLNDESTLYFYDIFNKINNIPFHSDILQIVEEIDQVKKLCYPREFNYDFASSYEKFLYIAYKTFLGYYIRSTFFEPVDHPLESKIYNINDFIQLCDINN